MYSNKNFKRVAHFLQRRLREEYPHRKFVIRYNSDDEHEALQWVVIYPTIKTRFGVRKTKRPIVKIDWVYDCRFNIKNVRFINTIKSELFKHSTTDGRETLKRFYGFGDIDERPKTTFVCDVCKEEFVARNNRVAADEDFEIGGAL